MTRGVPAARSSASTGERERSTTEWQRIWQAPHLALEEARRCDEEVPDAPLRRGGRQARRPRGRDSGPHHPLLAQLLRLLCLATVSLKLHGEIFHLDPLRIFSPFVRPFGFNLLLSFLSSFLFLFHLVNILYYIIHTFNILHLLFKVFNILHLLHVLNRNLRAAFLHLYILLNADNIVVFLHQCCHPAFDSLKLLKKVNQAYKL